MGEGRIDEPPTNQRRLTVAQAADSLGITEGAVRSRIKRGTLPTTRDSGTVFVLLGGGTSQANQSPNIGAPTDQSEFVEELRDRIAYLERQVEEEREARRRADTIIAQLSAATAEQARTIRAIEAPGQSSNAADVPEDAETVEEEPESAEPRSSTAGPQTAPQRPDRFTLRGLRQRFFGR